MKEPTSESEFLRIIENMTNYLEGENLTNKALICIACEGTEEEAEVLSVTLGNTKLCANMLVADIAHDESVANIVIAALERIKEVIKNFKMNEDEDLPN